MSPYERYYRRSYNALNRLIDVYRNGYNQEKMFRFRNDLIEIYNNNPTTISSEFNSIMFTAMVALLGLNKEAIERTGKFVKYTKNNYEVDLSVLRFSDVERSRIKQFYDSKILSTDFDSWLSIIATPTKDSTNADYLKRIRNALLHSNFYLDENIPLLPFAKLNTKNYYEAELFNMQFQMFVFRYFGNIEATGLAETIYTFTVPKHEIKDKHDLFIYLYLMKINEITYTDLKSLDDESPELILKSCINEEGVVDVSKFIKKLAATKNSDNIKMETKSIPKEYFIDLINYIDKTYGDNFYKMDSSRQGGIISTHLKYRLNPKTELSNWISHFWYFYSALLTPKKMLEFFNGDDFGTESCYPALMVLKSYLIMYRLQNNNFDEVDYNKINFDINDPDIVLYSDNVNKEAITENYFINSFNKEKNKGILTEENEIWMKIICEVIRNSLAHGNIRTYTSPITLEPIIEFKDIDPRKGTIRTIVIPIQKYEKFLNSEAFLPSNCYKKESSKTLVRK